MKNNKKIIVLYVQRLSKNVLCFFVFSLKKEELRYRRISLFCSFIVLVTQFIYHLSDA